MPPVFVDARQLAEHLDVPYATLLKWVREGSIPHIRDGRNRLMFNLNSVRQALLKRSPADDLEPVGECAAPMARPPAADGRHVQPTTP